MGNNINFLSDKEIEGLTPSEKKAYYSKLKDYCLGLKDYQLHFGQDLIHHAYPMLEKYKLINFEIEIEGEENIPKDTPAIFVVNHSNSHDIFTMYEALSRLGRKASAMVATDCLNPITTAIFSASNATTLDRRIKESRESAVFRMAHKAYFGYDLVICGESTWNLHPTKLMHNIKKGPVKIQAITQFPVLPTIMEYIEVDDYVQKEQDLYIKCVIRFGKAREPDYEESMSNQAQQITEAMAVMRKNIWENNNIKRESLDDVDPIRYILGTVLKKNTPFFKYDSAKEFLYLFFKDGEPRENEYYINDSGVLVPGITKKDDQIISKILRRRSNYQ